jgi:RsiW-degrading membrane proteinase PrsW (M82 family)
MQTTPSHPRGTVAQIVLAILGMVIYGVAGVFFLISAFSTTGAKPTVAEQVTSLSLALTAFTALLLMIPSLVLARRSTQPTSITKINRPLLIAVSIVMVIWGGVIYLGNSFTQTSAKTLLLPFLQVFAAGLPLVFIFFFASNGLSAGSEQRRWGIFNFSLSVTPLVIIILEAFVLLVFGLVILFALLMQPGVMNNIQSFFNDLQSLTTNPSLTNPLVTQFGQSSGVLIGLLLLVAFVIPLIEEIMKPLGLIVLARRKPSPSQGFVAGMICGAGFAFLETSGALAGTAGADWTLLAITRLGTGLLHITASGLMGWGLASLITLKKPGRFWKAYISAAALHGTWNGFAILMGYFPMMTDTIRPNLQVANSLGKLAPFVLVAITLGLIAILTLMNRKLRREAATPPSIPIPPVTEPPSFP